MVPQRQVQNYTGVRSCSRKIPMKCAGRYMVLRTPRGSTFAPVEKKAPERSVSGSEDITASMSRSVETWTVDLIW